MLGYAALLDNSFGEQLRVAFNNITSLLRDVPFYWYIVALAMLFVLFKLLIKG